jgi:hypothetical protein
MKNVFGLEAQSQQLQVAVIFFGLISSNHKNPSELLTSHLKHFYLGFEFVKTFAYKEILHIREYAHFCFTTTMNTQCYISHI